MLKSLTFMTAALAFFATGAQADDWQDAVKQSVDATAQIDTPLLPDGTTATSDLTLDSGFGNAGMSTFWPAASAGTTPKEDGLRVFSYRTCTPIGDPPLSICSHSGYYVAGRQQLSDGSWQGLVTRLKLDGTVDTTFATNGWATITHLGAFASINDFALLGNKLYMAATGTGTGGYRFFYIVCRDLSTNLACSGFGLGGGINQSFATRGATDAVAQRVVANSTYGVFAAGYVKTTRGWEMGVVRLDKDSGARLTEFNGDGLDVDLPDWAVQTNADIDVFDMAVAPASTPGGARLYLAGKAKRNGGEYDGYVLALDPASSNGIAGWGPWKAFYYESDNTGFKNDAITAITVQRNGKLAMAGWSETDIAGDRRMILARSTASGAADNGFCGNGICLPVDSGILPTDDLPVAIAERGGNHDLVVALRANKVSLSDPHTRQAVWQFSASGKTRHYEQVMDYSASSGVTQWSRPFGLWIGNQGFLGIGQEVVAVVGTRLWSGSDFDMTLGQMIPTDSIFANQFGKSDSD